MPELPSLQPVATQPLSLVLLARNAEAHVVSVVEGWRQTLSARNIAFEIVVVDDGSSDQTAELAGQVPEVKLLRHDKPRGIGAALRTGLEATTHPLLACAVCDPAYRPEDLAPFLASIDKVHFLTGYRAADPIPGPLRLLGMLARLFSHVIFSGASPRLPGWLGWRGHFGSLLARIFFGVRLRDLGCPYRVFRREVLARSPLQSNGSFALVEQIAKINFAGHLFGEEIPLSISPAFGWYLQPTGVVLREARRLFSHPSFGPPTV
jgi:glycosyltransferase involved in cell wall biosynthesis